MNGDINPNAVDFLDLDEETIDASSERDRLSQSVVSSTDWTTETIISQLTRGNIQLNPNFQRRDAWTIIRKSRFIESLMLGLPVPQIVLAEVQNQRGKYIVLDGKQRLLSLLQFRGAGEGPNNGFKLKGMEVLTDLNNLSYSDLENNALNSDLFDAFNNQSIRSVVIKNWPDVLFLHLIFLRLNTGSVKLSAQELRQAMFPGPFSDFADNFAQTSSPLKSLLGITEPDFRMRDVEILVRYFAFLNFMNDYAGELKTFLDYTCDEFNTKWYMYKNNIISQSMVFNEVVESLIIVFGADSVARRPIGVGRRPFNRAIFDVQSFYLTDPAIRQAALDNIEVVRTAFQELWNSDEDFVKSVESTTKSIIATHTRFSAWGNKLGDALGIAINTPSIVNNRIIF